MYITKERINDSFNAVLELEDNIHDFYFETFDEHLFHLDPAHKFIQTWRESLLDLEAAL